MEFAPFLQDQSSASSLVSPGTCYSTPPPPYNADSIPQLYYSSCSSDSEEDTEEAQSPFHGFNAPLLSPTTFTRSEPESITESFASSLKCPAAPILGFLDLPDIPTEDPRSQLLHCPPSPDNSIDVHTHYAMRFRAPRVRWRSRLESILGPSQPEAQTRRRDDEVIYANCYSALRAAIDTCDHVLVFRRDPFKEVKQLKDLCETLERRGPKYWARVTKDFYSPRGSESQCRVYAAAWLTQTFMCFNSSATLFKLRDRGNMTPYELEVMARMLKRVKNLLRGTYPGYD